MHLPKAQVILRLPFATFFSYNNPKREGFMFDEVFLELDKCFEAIQAAKDCAMKAANHSVLTENHKVDLYQEVQYVNHKAKSTLARGFTGHLFKPRLR
jgi:hypothetical protein